MNDPENIARAFHEVYERLAADVGYVTREESATIWELVPDKNRSLMIAVVAELLERGVIRGGCPVDLNIRRTKFKVGERVRVTRRYSTYFGDTGTVVKRDLLHVTAKSWDVAVALDHSPRVACGFNTEELEQCPS